MAQIQTYNDHVTAQGQITSQAHPNDFGANLGEAITYVGDVIHENEVKDDVTNIHVEMAKKRAEWQQKLTDMGNSTQPGDQTLAPRVMEGLQQDLTGLGDSVKTRQGQQALAKMSADMTSMFGQEAIGIQSRLNGEFAKNQYNTLSQSLGGVAAQDHTQWESLVQQGKAAIDDPNGLYAKLPEPTKEAFRQSIEQEIKYDAAKGFARRFPNSVLSSVPPELRNATQSAVAKQPTQGLPPNLNAPVVKPYDQAAITSRSKQVLAPSQYDQLFKDAGQLYNVDWRELKLRAAVESGLDAKADNGQAKGLMQFTPETAKKFNIDPFEPGDAVFAAAKMLAGYRTKANGDMAVVDQMYYGGEAGTAWGPNTKQYAANMAALRQSIGLGSAVPPEAFAPSATEQTAASQNGVKPKTGIGFIDSLPADKFFSIMTEAEHYQRAADSQSERARIEQDRQTKKVQDATIDTMLKRIIQPNEMNGGQLSEQEIMGNNALSWEQKQHMVDYSMRRTRELAANAEAKSNPAEVRRLMLDIHAADDNPTKSYNMDPVMQSYKQGSITTNEMTFLRKEVEQMRDGNTSGFQKQVQMARNNVNTAFTRSIIGQAQPEVAADASYRFMMDMENKIAEYRKENKNPSVLLDPMSREYLLKPERVQSFMNGSSQALNDGATRVAKAEATSLPTYKDYDSLAKGTSYTDPQGNVRVKK